MAGHEPPTEPIPGSHAADSGERHDIRRRHLGGDPVMRNRIFAALALAIAVLGLASPASADDPNCDHDRHYHGETNAPMCHI